MRQSLYQKYRPKIFSDFIGQEKIVKTIKNALKSNQIGHAYLFAGQRGTGKTTIARLLAKTINCQNQKDDGPCLKCDICRSIDRGQIIDIIEIDAASNRGIDEIRDLREKIKFLPTTASYKIYIIDEVHMLTREAFNALLKTLEEPPKHVIFILATTEAHKLPLTILSRVQRFDFGRVPKADLAKNLKIIAESEKINIDQPAIELIANKADGSHRDAISLFELVKSYSTKISVKEVGEVLGIADQSQVAEIIIGLAENQRRAVLTQIENYFQAGFDLSQLALALAEMLSQAISDRCQAFFDRPTEEQEKAFRSLDRIDNQKLTVAIELLLLAAKEIKASQRPTLPLVVALSKIDQLFCDEKHQDNLEKSGEKNEDNSSTNSNNSKTAKKSEVREQIVERKSDRKDGEIKDEKSTEDSLKCSEIDRETWGKIIEGTKKCNHSLNALLRDIKPETVSGDQLILLSKFKFHSDKISESKNRQLIEGVIEEVLGRRLKIVCKLVDGQPKKNQSINENELLKNVEELLD